MAFVSGTDINEIRAKANLVDIIGSYIPLTQRGRNYVCVCPFHDDHSPSMSVSPEKQIYKCFACGATGNVFTFVSEYENVSFAEAVKIVASKCGIEVKEDLYKSSTSNTFKEEYEIMDLAEKYFQNNLKTKFGVSALDYLHNRGINDDIIKEFGIGLSLDDSNSLFNLLTKKNFKENSLLELGLINKVNDNIYDYFSKRITFPLWDKDGHIVGFSARIYRGEKDVSKYMNTKETKIFKKGETLYNYHNAKDASKREKQIIIVEGFMDAIRLAVNGVKNVVALQGTAMTHDQINLLKKLRTKVVLCLDNDNAGLLATVNNGQELVNNGIETFVIRLSGEKDPDEYIIANGIEAFLENLKKPISFFEFKMNYLKNGKNMDNAEDLANYINEVLKSLSENDDEILREITLNKIADEYNVSLDILRKKMSLLSPNEVIVKTENKIIKEPKKRNSYTIAVEKVLFLMLNGLEYISNYQKKLGFLSESLYREIANEIVYYAEANKEITVADFITYVNDKESIKEKVMEIVNDSVNDEVNIEAMDEYIDVVLKVSTKNEIKRLKELQKNELDIDKKMKIAMQIAELKKGSANND